MTGPSRTPRRKVIAAGAGGSIGGNIAVIFAYCHPDLPPDVVVAYTSLLVTALAVLSAYLTPEH